MHVLEEATRTRGYYTGQVTTEIVYVFESEPTD
jgi:hypothetical protein